MRWIILTAIVSFVIGVAVGIVWTNIAISNFIGRRFGW